MILLVLAIVAVVPQVPIQGAMDVAGDGAPPGQVTIYRDDWGTPHVYATREEDGFYGLGYAQAEDRLQTLLRFYLRVRGQQAAHFGADFVDVDFEVLQYRHLEEARAGFERLSPQLRENYLSFIAGVERYLQDHPSRVPAWAPELEPSLPIASMRELLWGRTIFDALVSWRAPGSRKAKCARAESPNATLGHARDRDGSTVSGSNEWVLMPWRTADGALIHLGDPHGGFGAFEFRIDAGPFKAASSNFPSFALPFIGHTRFAAWAFTLGGPDVSDCYAVLVDPANPRRYRYDDEWKEMVTEEVTVQVRDANPVTRVLEYTRHNGVLSPVVLRKGDTAYVVSIPMMHEAGAIDEQLYRMGLAKTMEEFREAIAPGLFAINLMAGGADGNALYVRAGRVPIRPPGHEWSQPVSGNSSETAWKGVHPFDDLIQVANPRVGYMQNTNIAPDMMMASGAPAADGYPSYLFNDVPGRTNTRARRAIELLSGAFSATVDDALEMALDDKWIGTELWQLALHDALNALPEVTKKKSPLFRRFAHRILQFDGFARKESVAALSYLYWRMSLDSLPAASTDEVIAMAQAIFSRNTLSPQQHRMLVSGVDRAVDRMIAEHGSIDLTYGDVHRVGGGGYSWPLGGGRFVSAAQPRQGSVVGDWAVVPLKTMAFTPPDSLGLRWAAGGGYHTTLTIFTDPIQSFSALPLGQSEDPTSPYFTNQARLISERRLRPTYFYYEDLMGHVVSEMTLETGR